MASDQTLRAIITVLDRTAEPLHQINARFAAMSAPLRRIGESISSIAEETGLKKIGEHARGALEQVRHLGEGILELAGPLAALGAAGSVAGLIEIAKSTAEFGESLKLGAIAAGLSTESLSGWHYAAQLANVDLRQLDRGFQYLNRNIAEAAMGKSKDVEAILSRMGLANTQGHLVGTADALKAVAAEAKHLVDSGQVQLADAMMSKLFGARSGAQLLPLFAQGPEAIANILDAAREHGIALGDAQAENAARFAESYKGMAAAVEGLKLAIGARLFPVLTPVIERVTKWIDANREWLATRIDGAVTQLADAISRVDWEGIIGGLKSAVSWTSWAIEKTIGFKWALIGLAAVSLSPTILAFWQLGAAIALTAVKFGLFPAAAFIVDLARMIPLIGSLSEAFAAFNLVLAANPLGALVLAATALAALGYEVYEHWEKVKQVLEWIGSHIPHIPGVSVSTSGAAAYDLRGNPIQPLTQLAGGGPAGGAAEKSETKVTIELKNLPPDAATKVETRGNPDLDMNVGYAMAF